MRLTSNPARPLGAERTGPPAGAADPTAIRTPSVERLSSHAVSEEKALESGAASAKKKSRLPGPKLAAAGST